ncbi:CCA tRNA nucleotidyltransferase [Tumebacillus permanentifrigoris]|uniref:tRNA nucleotidyltransferase (CCA-adding enzyme) n=1 Tax=Tumebacillus permanentifrigoris TaxID=378543 RepID=A0A316DBH4_9BACL|nr:CCA tRNA nucleotidyltransferase [Tumebacillus permanentifrigoris]PWK15551.1 tRNA nucleotidyltransferase (CCA-adding enzyme) [Tumebacillus permanentifrigoris]
MEIQTLEQEAWQVVDKLEAAGYEAYLVGGCVRDQQLQRPIYDYDITTSALPDEVIALFPHTVPTGIKHGTVKVIMEQGEYEVTTFRIDGEYIDGRRPASVHFVRSLVEDLARRDFTINAMAMSRHGRLHDPFDGLRDLEQRIICAVGDPVKRFEEDALRILRGIRFAAQLGFTLEERTHAAIVYEAQELGKIARERVREEWHKMLLTAPDVALDLLRQTETLRYVITRPPTFDLAVYDPWGYGIDPWQLAGTWAARAPVDLALRYAIVLRAIQLEEARIDKVMSDLKLSGALKSEIRRTLRVVQLGPPTEWRDRSWRQYFYQHGRDAVRRACLLYAILHDEGRLEAWEAEVEQRAAAQPLWSLQDLVVTGSDLIEAGLPEGPEIGRANQWLAQWVLDHPECNTREALLQKLSERIE